MFLLQQIAPAAFAAMLVVIVALGVGRWVPTIVGKALLGAVGVGIAYTVGHWKTSGWPAVLPPKDAKDWLLIFSLASVPIGMGYTFLRKMVSIRFVMVALFLGSALVTLLSAMLKSSAWAPPTGWFWIGGLTAASVVANIGIDDALRSSKSPFGLLWLIVLCAGVGVGLVVSGSLLLGQMGLILATIVLAASVTGWWAKSLTPALAPGITVILTGLVVCGHFYSNLPAVSAGIFAMAPVLGLVPPRPPSTETDIIRAGSVLVPLVVAIYIAVRQSPSLDY